MVLCDNVFCEGVTVEFEYVMLAGRRFCCVACAEDWHHQNEVLVEAGSAFHTPASGHRGGIREGRARPKVLSDSL
jgi:hypothetical protein